MAGVKKIKKMIREMRIFDDWKSYGHLAAGFTVSLMPRPLILVLSGVFVLFQTAEHWGDPISSVFDITEFAIGLALGLLADHRYHLSSRLSRRITEILGGMK